MKCNGNNNKCAQCGNCCKIIPLAFSYEQMKNLNPVNSYDKEFILKYWDEITCPIDIWKIQPDMRIDFKYNHYYTCKMFNKFENKCMAYKFRPPVCADYPFYPFKNYKKVNLIWDKCIFNEDEKL